MHPEGMDLSTPDGWVITTWVVSKKLCLSLWSLRGGAGKTAIYAIWDSLWLFGTPCGSDGKESACNAGDPGLIPGSGRSPGEGDGYPLQFSCLENPMDRGAWWATVHGACKKSNMTKQLTHTNTHTDVGAYIHMHVHTHTY